MSEPEQDERALEVPAEPDDSPEETTPPEGAPEEPFDEARAQAKIRKANAEAQALRARLKAAEAKAAKLDELENANKSEQQRAIEAREAAEKRAEAAEQRLLRLEIAAEKGLTPAQAKRLVGSTREELEADADELLETFAAPPRAAEAVPRRPRARLKAGGAEEEPPEEKDPRKLAAMVKSRSPY